MKRLLLLVSLLLVLTASVQAQSYNIIIDVTKPPYNAKGNDVDDDTAAIQAAVTAAINAPSPCCRVIEPGVTPLWANAVVVYFPRGTYKLDGTINLGGGGNRLILRGDGFAGSGSSSVLRSTNPNNDILDATGLTDALSIENLYFQGPGAGLGSGNAIRVNAVDSRITRNWFNGIPNACIYAPAPNPYAAGLTNTHIVDNGIELARYGILLDRSVNNVIQENRFYGLGTGIHLKWGEFNQIANNFFDVSGRAAGTAAIVVDWTTAPEIRQLQITGNLFNKNGDDIRLKGANLPAPTVTNVFIQGNTTDRPLRSFVHAETVADLSIIGNRIADASAIEQGGDPQAQYPAIRITGASNRTVLYDNVHTMRLWPAKYGLQVDGQTTETAIGANVFRGQLAAVYIAEGATLAATHVQEPITTAKETGVAGFRFWADGASRSGAYNVTFRMKRERVPNVALSNCTVANVAGGAPFVTNVTADGFRFNLTSAGAGDVYAVDCTYTVTEP